MRYDKSEAPIPAGVLPAGIVTCEVLDQTSNTLLGLTSNVATQTALSSVGGKRVFQFPLSNLSTPITGFSQLLVQFKHEDNQHGDICKVMVRGYVDKATSTLKLVGTLL